MHARALKSTKNLSLRKWTEYTGKVFFLQTAAAFAEQTQSKQEEKKEKKNIKADSHFQKSKHWTRLLPPNICGQNIWNKEGL